jgi:uncharacterized FAD-dependent dehydrogenase
MSNKYAEFKKFGQEGAKKRWDKTKATRKELLERVSGQVDKPILDLIQAHMNNDQIEKLLKIWKI